MDTNDQPRPNTAAPTMMNNTLSLTAANAPGMCGIETLFGLIKGARPRHEPPSKAMVEFQKFLDERHGGGPASVNPPVPASR